MLQLINFSIHSRYSNGTLQNFKILQINLKELTLFYKFEYTLFLNKLRAKNYHKIHTNICNIDYVFLFMQNRRIQDENSVFLPFDICLQHPLTSYIHLHSSLSVTFSPIQIQRQFHFFSAETKKFLYNSTFVKEPFSQYGKLNPTFLDRASLFRN